MRLNAELLEMAEDFFDLVANEEESVELDLAMDHLRRFIEDEVDGESDNTACEVAQSVQDQLEEIWSLITPEEKANNDQLGDYYQVLMEDLNIRSGYEGGSFNEDEESPNQDTFLQDYDEEAEMDEEEEDWD